MNWRAMVRGRGWQVVGATALAAALVLGGSAGSHAASVPSGTLAFVGADGIYVQRADGVARRIWQVPAGSTVDEPRWSPDGTRLAFDGPDGNIWTVNADGSSAHALTSQAVAPADCGEDGCGSQGSRADSPRWSPDGTHVSYRLVDGLAHASIWTIGASSGAGTQQIATAEDMCIFNEGWSPAGAPLFSRCPGNGGPSNGSYLSTGGGQRPFVAGSQLAYSRDGSRLAFANQAFTDGGISVSLFVTAADGSGAQVVATGGQMPRWSSAGQLAYQVSGGDGPVIHVYDPTSGADTVLGPGSLGGWTPDGGWVYFTRQDGTTSTIWRIRADGSDATQVATGGAPDWA